MVFNYASVWVTRVCQQAVALRVALRWLPDNLDVLMVLHRVFTVLKGSWDPVSRVVNKVTILMTDDKSL